MKRLLLIGIFIALLLGVLAIVSTWTHVRTESRAVAPDTASSPNPDPRPK